MKKIVVLSGAGISAESGIKTFRDSNGLWENHRVEDVASPEGFRRNPELVLNFYNQRRKQLFEVEPNAAHTILAELEKNFDVHVITQNVDDLHERAGSTKVLHLHGELRKVRPINEESKGVLHWEGDLNLGDVNEKGVQLRPHIVWFGEAVPMLDEAIEITRQADIFIVIGTSLQVYPAAGLIDFIKDSCELFVIDPNLEDRFGQYQNFFQLSATEGMKKLKGVLLSQ
ncbi:MAG: NAD-dependent deacylase [Bacteroidota bacterium]